MGTHPIFESDFDCLTEEMVKRKSATRRNKSFKAVDPFAKGKSSKGLGTDQGFDYGGRAEIGSTKMLKKSLKGQKMNPATKKKKEKPVHTKTTAVHKLMMEGRNKPDAKVHFVKRSYESKREFLARIQHECDNTIKMTNATKNRNIAKEFVKASKHDKKMAQREKDGEEAEQDTYGMDRKEKYRLELRNRELSAKSEKHIEKELEKAEKAEMTDTVRFGERVDQPPQFSGKWAKNRTTKGIKNLLLMDKLMPPEHSVIDHAQEMENERTRAIEAYRKLKNRERL